jgi:hypothetical protein
MMLLLAPAWCAACAPQLALPLVQNFYCCIRYCTTPRDFDELDMKS